MEKTNLTKLILEYSHIGALINKKMDLCLSVHGISFTEYVIMHNLHYADGGFLNQIGLAESVGLTASGVTRLLAPMIKNNIVEKTVNPRDARQSLVSLSRVGDGLFKDASVSVEQSCKKVFSLFEPDDLIALSSYLKKIKC